MKMKKAIILFLLALTSGRVLSQNIETTYLLSKDESILYWKAYYMISGGHEGTMQLLSGNVTTFPDRQLKGEFVMDINSIENTDIKPKEDGDGLEEHLRSDDFFSSMLYPKGFFSILKTEQLARPGEYTVTGFLTLKALTHQISFPATIQTEKGVMKVQAVITIDRTKWEINYNSKTIFDDLKDGVISDNIEIRLNLVLKNQSGQLR
jgi:polyisoprenoid-binding protein YceI